MRQSKPAERLQSSVLQRSSAWEQSAKPILDGVGQKIMPQSARKVDRALTVLEMGGNSSCLQQEYKRLRVSAGRGLLVNKGPGASAKASPGSLRARPGRRRGSPGAGSPLARSRHTARSQRMFAP